VGAVAVAKKLTASMPGEFDLPPNFIVQVTALDATAGTLVSGVNVSNVAIMAAPVTPSTEDTGTLFEPTTPIWLPVPLTDQTP